MNQPTDPVVENALTLLRAFHIESRYTAAIILRHWVHYDQLTVEQVRQVLNAFPSRGRP